MMSDMSDEFDTTEAEFDAMYAEGTPVEVGGPGPLFGATFAPGALTRTLGASTSSALPDSPSNLAVTATAR